MCPSWRWARSYRREDLPHDLVAGLVLGIVTVPQAIAYAFLAGMPAEAGLYACLAPMVIYAALGSSRQMVVGPVAIAALMVAAAVGEHAAAYSDQYLVIVHGAEPRGRRAALAAPGPATRRRRQPA